MNRLSKVTKFELGLIGFLMLVTFSTLATGASFGPKIENRKQKNIELTGVLTTALEGKYDFNVEIFVDANLTEPLFSKEFKGVQVNEGFYTLKINTEEAGLEAGKSYGLRIEVLGEEGIPVTEAKLEIVPEQTFFAFEGEEGGAGITAQQYNLTRNYPYPQAVVTVTNSGTGSGINSVSKRGIGLQAESQSAQGYGLYAKNTAGGTAFLSEGKAKVQGDLEVTGQTDLMSVNLPADSVESNQIVDGSIVNADIAGNANIAASKINRTGLDADTLDGRNSTDFIPASGDATVTGNLTVQGTGSSSFAGNLGIGTTNPTQKLDVNGAVSLGSWGTGNLLTILTANTGNTEGGLLIQSAAAGSAYIRYNRGNSWEASY